MPGESHGQRSLADYNSQDRRESDMTEATKTAPVTDYHELSTLNNTNPFPYPCVGPEIQRPGVSGAQLAPLPGFSKAEAMLPVSLHLFLELLRMSLLPHSCRLRTEYLSLSHRTEIPFLCWLLARLARGWPVLLEATHVPSCVFFPCGTL